MIKLILNWLFNLLDTDVARHTLIELAKKLSMKTAFTYDDDLVKAMENIVKAYEASEKKNEHH